MVVNIRHVKLSDREDFLKIEAGGENLCVLDNFLRCFPPHNNYDGWVAERDGIVFGSLVTERAENCWHIINVAVDPSQRRGGCHCID